MDDRITLFCKNYERGTPSDYLYMRNIFFTKKESRHSKKNIQKTNRNEANGSGSLSVSESSLLKLVDFR